MAQTLDHVLERRAHRVGRRQWLEALVVSAVLHGVLTAVGFFAPRWLAPPPETFEFVSVTVVPPKALGVTDPQPPPPPTRSEKPPAPEPAPPPPPPKKEPPKVEEKAPDPEVPVLPSKKKPPKTESPPAAPAPAQPAPAVPAAPPKREGSPFGNPFGSSSSNAVVGVEDPNFTYGYYLDRVLSAIDGNWSRPPVGSEIEEAYVYFKILKDGQITEVRLVRPSGSEIFDRAALRAVEVSSPLPPLPTSYPKDQLGIQLIVK